MKKIFPNLFFAISNALHLLTGIGHTCRFTPTCSHYAGEVVVEFGIFKGLFLFSKRLLNCHPWALARRSSKSEDRLTHG